MSKQASDHLGHRLVRRRHHDGQAHLRADLPPRGHPRGLDRGRRLPPLRPRGDEGRARRAARGRRRDLQPLQLRGQHARGPRAGLPRVRRDRHGPHPALRPRRRARPRRYGAAAGHLHRLGDVRGRQRPALLRGPARRPWPTARSTSPRYADLKIGVVPVINLEWIQKIHRDRAIRGYSTEAVTDVILRRMHALRALHLPAVHRDRHQLPAGADRRHLEPVHRPLDTDRRRERAWSSASAARAGSTSPTSSR